MDFLTVLKTRRSVRRFGSKPVAEGTIEQLIELAAWAPSACDRQEWRFIVVKDRKAKDRIVELGGAIIIRSAPVVILVLYSNQTTNLEYQDHVQSAAAATQNLLLAAHYFGLAGCWVCHLPPKKALRKLLSIPKEFDPMSAVILGYPSGPPAEVRRKRAVAEITSDGRFDFPQAPHASADSHLKLRRFLTFVYKHSPVFLKRTFLNKLADKKFVKKFDN